MTRQARSRRSEGDGQRSFGEVVELHTRGQVERERQQLGCGGRLRAAAEWCERELPDLCVERGTPIVVGAALTLRYSGRLSPAAVRDRLEAA